MQILFQTHSFVVAVKDPNVLSENGPDSMPVLLSQSLGRTPESIFPVHRLDRMTGGVMVYALTPESAGKLSQEIASHLVRKRYLAVCTGVPDSASGEWTDLLFWDRIRQKSYVVDRKRKGVKTAELSYQRLAVGKDGTALFSVDLSTGRTHQIRVQFASRGFPLLGDKRYGSPTGGPLGLWAFSLSFRDPETGRMLQFMAPPPQQAPWTDEAFSVFCRPESPMFVSQQEPIEPS